MSGFMPEAVGWKIRKIGNFTPVRRILVEFRKGKTASKNS